MAYVRGLQGENLTDGVMATGKHFIGHSLSQGGLNCGPVHVGRHELYEIFLAPFQAAIRDAGLASIMNSYPELPFQTYLSLMDFAPHLDRPATGQTRFRGPGRL